MISGVEVATLEGAAKILPADTLLAFFGLAAKLGPIADWGLTLAGNAVVADPAHAHTNISGVFAVGDMAAYDGKLKLISVGFAEAARAAHGAFAHINPDAALHMEYSTTKGVPAGQ